MANSIKTINLLPEFLRTDKNNKFLSSTIDQWIKKPELERIDGYVGSVLTPTYNSTADVYISESLPLRKQYQLEPAVVIKDNQNVVQGAVAFDDLVNEISISGGQTKNFDKLFRSEFYSYDPHIDLDKLVNYTEYYWLTTGPNTVVISGQPTNTTSTFTVRDNEVESAFIFTPNGLTPNPIVTLYRGNTYNFDVSSVYKFYIKTDASSGPFGALTHNITNNGVTTGTVTLTIDQYTPETLYYISGTDDKVQGQFVVKDSTQNSIINVEEEVIGKQNYRSGTGIELSNGMKIRFGGTVIPEAYQNKEYWVEGVGESIKLIDYDLLTSPESMATVYDESFDATGFDNFPFDNFKTLPITPEYITVNRASKDLNPWSRYNRWVHSGVIKTSAEASGQVPVYPVNLRARRPIVEFKADLKLYNFGTTGIQNVDLIDNVTRDAFSMVEGSAGYHVDGVLLQQGNRIIFNADTDPSVRGKIYEVNYVTVNSYRTRIQLVPVTTSIAGYSTSVNYGTSATGTSWWYNGTNWVYSQQHNKLNQAPFFDLFDKNGNSYSDTTAYQSNFSGTKIFGYEEGTNGSNDVVLGFPLKYQNSVGVGSYLFKNYFSTDQISVSVNNVETITVSAGQTFLKFAHSSGDVYANVWTSAEPYRIPVIQFQNITTATSLVEITAIDNPTMATLTIDVIVNNTKLDTTNYTTISKNSKLYVSFNSELSVNSSLLFKLYTDASVNNNGYYEVPLGLTNNPLNGPITNFTLSELSDHLGTAVTRLPNFVGTFPGVSNLRDRPDVARYGSRLISNANPMAFAHLFIGKKEHSVINAITKVSDQYNQFKMSFLNKMITVGNLNDTIVSVDTILRDLNFGKNLQSPYFLSDMIAYGNDKITRQWTVKNSKNTVYPITSDFNPTLLGLRSVLVYINGEQILLGQDYNFIINDSAIEILTDLAVGDVITVNDYATTEGCFIPPTPSKLGLHPKFKPTKYVDDTYSTPTNVIQCHDGSIMVAYNDFRDDIILELEKRIYNNIKATYQKDLFDINSVLPGAFRNSQYSLTDCNSILINDFIKWSGFYGIEYTENSTFDPDNAFTWNYSGSTNKLLSIQVDGNWRSIYKFFYDTDRPHTAPWEMLGFESQPTWWEDVYGPAPYTSGNYILWEDLEKGLIKYPSGWNIDPTYIRTGLKDIIPVDEAGNLIDPTVLLLSEYTPYSVRQNWKFGDQGPAETAWRRSSYWPFALQKLLALLKPASYASLMYDPSRMSTNQAGQWSYDNAGSFLNPKNVKVFDTQTTLTSGYSVFLVEAGKQRSINYVDELTQDLNFFDINLFHKVGGFVNKGNLQIVIDAYDPASTGPGALLPQENYQLYLNTSNPINTTSISGLIIQKVEGKFVIKGYDKYRPYFTVYTPIRNSSTPTLSVGGISSPYINWTAGTADANASNLNSIDLTTANSSPVGKFYKTGQIVSYGNRYYIVIKDHYAESVFNPAYYKSLPSLPISGGATVQTYYKFDKVKVQIPYGTQFDNAQQVYDFIVGYGDWLVDQGFVFNQYNSTLNSVLDWNFTAKEFLYWTTQNWANNSIIALSPFADQLQFKFNDSIVDNIFDSFYDYNVLKENGFEFPKNNLNIGRDEGVCTIRSINTTEGIYFAQLNSVQKEHAMVFDNTTVFNDTIYDIETGYRQRRVKLIGFRTANWNGDYFTPGFVYDTAQINTWAEFTDYKYGEVVRFNSKYYSAIQDVIGSNKFNFTEWVLLGSKPVAELIPNFDYKINQFEDFYSLDIDNFDSNQQELAQHLVGYTPRVYLNNIFINPIAQYKFYQGFIKEKGSKNSIIKLSKASIQNLQGAITFNEEWAFRVGNYGSFGTYNEIEMTLHEGSFTGNPQSISFVDAVPTIPDDLLLYKTPKDLSIVPEDYSPSTTFITTSTSNFELMSAGYVNLNDVTSTAYNEYSFISIANTRALNDGEVIWLGNTNDGDWDVRRYQRSTAGIISVQISTPAESIVFSTDIPHRLSIGEIISVSQYDDQVNGVYRVIDVLSQTEFMVSSALSFITTFTTDSPGLLFKFESVRYSNFDLIPSDQDLQELPYGSKYWIDNDISSSWKVYEKIDNYSITHITTNTSGSSYGSTIYKNKGENIVIETSPYYSSPSRFDVGTIFVKYIDLDGYIFNYNINQRSYNQYYTGTVHTEFGASVVYDSQEYNNTGFGIFYAGAPGASGIKSSSGPTGLRYASQAGTASSSVHEGLVKISSVDPLLFTEFTEKVLLSPAPGNNDRFGQSIFVQTNNTSTKKLLISAPGNNGVLTGSVHLYNISLTTATSIAFNRTIAPPVSGAGIEWGYSIAGVSDATAVTISAPSYLQGTGYVAVLTGTNYSNLSQIIFGNTVGFDKRSRFGDKVLVSDDGEYLFVTAPGFINFDNSRGAVAVFQKVNALFTLTQFISNPVAGPGMIFGQDLDISTKADKLIVSALGTDRIDRSFDNKLADNTTFDSKTTIFEDSMSKSGCVFVYDRYESRFVFAQEINPGNLTTATNFGQSIVLDETEVLIGAPNTNITADGQLDYSATYRYSKVDPSVNSWKILRQFDNLVDVDTLQKVRLINTFDDTIITYLDVIDPLKGKIAGVADEEIRYKTSIDPAIYSIGTTSTTVLTDTNWTTTQVGELWWDLSTVKYVWYEQGDLNYRKNNWGRLFPGCSIDVYEWVESTYLPSEWAELADTASGISQGISGQPKFPDNTVLSVKQGYDAISNSFTNIYYYWVKNKVLVPETKNRRISAYDVSLLINDPSYDGGMYAAIISGHGVMISNVAPELVGDRINLNIAFDNIKNQIPRHTEWLLLEENSSTSAPNALLEKKLIDSLLGHDSLGTAVPDPTLSSRVRYGVGIRPQQTLFKDRLGALRNLVEFSNSVLKENITTGRYNFANLNAQELIPDQYSHEYDRIVEDNYTLETIDTRKLVQAELTAQVYDGKIIGVTITNPGFGYIISPTVTLIGSCTEIGKITTIIDANGRVTAVDIVEAGNGYSADPKVEVRPFTVIVQADSIYNGKWSKFTWKSELGLFIRAQTQKFNTSLYWNYVDWTSADYNQYQDYVFTVDAIYGIYTLTDVAVGDYVKIKNSGDGNYIILEKIPAGTVGTFGNGYNIVYKQNGTIQISDAVWNISNSTYGFDQTASYDQTLYDQTPDLELQYLLSALKNDIFINELKVNWNNFFFKAVKYAMSEQKLLDWAFKTSFINVTNNAGTLDQRPVYKLQNTKYFEDYISEVKPYHSQIRSFTTQYGNLEQSHSYTTDFDLPTQYNSETDTFESITSNSTLTNVYPWKSWNDNRTFTVGSIVVGNPGAGYTISPTVEITAQPGDLGTGATAVAYIRSGQIISIEVTNPGSGYLVPPTVTIKGGGSTTLTPARAYAQLYNGKVRSNIIEMKFDRINRYNQIGDARVSDSFICNGIQNEWVLGWVADANKSDITVTLDKIRVLSADYTITYYTEKYNGYNKKYCKIVFLNYIPKNNQILAVSYRKSKTLFTALERIENYYEPTSGMPGKVPAQLMSGLEYPRTQIQGLSLTATTHWDVLFGSNVYSGFGDASYADDISYYTKVSITSTATAGTSTVSVNTTTGLVVGQYANIISNTVNQFSTSTVKILSINTASSKVTFDSSISNTLTDATIELWSYDPNSTTLDTAIDGGNLLYNTALGISPDEIIIDGDKFYTSNTGFAPEEMLDGQVTESLGINVYTKNANGAPLIFSSSFDIVAGTLVTQPLTVIPTTVNSITISFNNTVFSYNSTTNFVSAKEFSIDWASGSLILPPQPLGGKVSYRVIGIGGGNPDAFAGVVDYQILSEHNEAVGTLVSLSGINTIQSAFVTVDGMAISTGTSGLYYTLGPDSLSNERAAVTIHNLPSGDHTLQAWFFGTEVDYYNELTEQIFTVGLGLPVTSFVLSNPPSTVHPADAEVLVEIKDGGGRRQLLPPYISYYQVTNTNDRTFTIDNHVLRPPSTYNLNTVRVYRNGVALLPGFDFNVNVNDNTVTVYPNILAVDDAIAVLGLVPGDYDYDIVGNILNVPLQSGQGVLNAEIKIITYNDQDGMLIQTERFPGNPNKRFKLSRSVLHLDYAWVSLNGAPLKSGIDYDILDDAVTLQLSDAFIITTADDIVVTTISSNKLSSTVLGYRIFVDMLGRTHYKRLSKQATTRLTRPLSHTDKEIYVEDASVLTPPLISQKIPGVVLIDAERIEYLEIDGNTLRKLRRSTLGTAPSFYADINTKVIDQSPSQTIPYTEIPKKQIQFTRSTTSTYKISTGTFSTATTFNTATVVRSDGILLSSDFIAENQISVYYGGRELRKTGTFIHDTTFAYDSPPGSVLGTTATVSGLPLTSTMGDSYIVTSTNQVWVYTGDTKIDAVNGYVYQGLTYLAPEFTVNTSTGVLMLNMSKEVQDDIELVIVQKQYSQTAEWNNYGISLMNSTTDPAKFLQQQPAELPDVWYYGGDVTLRTSGGTPLTDGNQEPIQGF